MTESSFEKWPVELKVIKLAGSILGQELDLYFVSGVMNKTQFDTLKQKLPIQSDFEIGKDKVVISTLVTHKQLMRTYEEFTRLAKEWRGAYYVITNKYVEVCKPFVTNE